LPLQPWQFLDHPTHRRATIEDYYSDDGIVPGGLAEDDIHFMSETSSMENPIPLVQRETPINTQLYEQFSAAATPQTTVTRVDLNNDYENQYVEPRRAPRSGHGHRYPDNPPAIPGERDGRTRGYHQPGTPRHMPEVSPSDTVGYSWISLYSTFQVHKPIIPIASGSSAGIEHTLNYGTPINVGVVYRVLHDYIKLQFRKNQVPTEVHDRGRPTHSSVHKERLKRSGRTYYIVPPGMNVIFRDENGNELTR